MPQQRRAIGLTPMETRRDVIVEIAQLADSLDYESIQIPEGWGMDSSIVLAEVALATKRIRPTSGILSIWGRTPATLAMNTATLADISDGRYVLGLGVSTPAIVEGFHDLQFERPAARLAATTREIRSLLAGERANLTEGTGTRPLRLGQNPRPDQEIYVAALGPLLKKVAAELADGWMPVFIARDQLSERTAEVLEHRCTSGADSAGFTVSCGPMVAVADTHVAGRALAASNLAWYICAMGDTYARLISQQGYEAEVQAVIAANPKPSPTRSVIPPEANALLDQFLVFGDEAAVAEGLLAWDSVVDLVSIGLPPGAPMETLERVVRAGAPEPRAGS